MNTSLSCSPVPMGVASKRNRTSIIRSNDPVHVEVTGSYWPRLVIEEHDCMITKKGKYRKNKAFKPAVVKVEKLTKKNKIKLLKLLQQNPKAPMTVPLPSLRTANDVTYQSMVSSATEGSVNTTTSPLLSSWEPLYTPAPVTPERPQMEGRIWPHVVENKPSRPYSPTSILRLRPRLVSDS